MAFLKVYSNGEERTVFLGDKKIIFGRGDDADVLLKDVKASRHHCSLEPVGAGEWRVRDLGSANGTKLNGERVGVESLCPNDVVQVGDARILFAAEAAAILPDAREEREERDEEATRPVRAPARRSSMTGVLIAAGVVVAVVVLGFMWQSRGKSRGDPRELSAYRAVLAAKDESKIAQLAADYLAEFPGSAHAAEVRAKGERARARVNDGSAARAAGFDASSLVEGLPLHEAVPRLEELLKEATAARRPLIEHALTDYRERLGRERERLFVELENIFRGHVEDAEFARAREIWFFLKGEPAWEPIPDSFRRRVVDAMGALENSASVRRTELLESVARAEEAHDFVGAKELLLAARQRFVGTSVERSLDERIEFLDRAIRDGVEGAPTKPRTDVPREAEKQVATILEGMRGRDFTAAAAALRTLADSCAETKAFAEIDARAREVEAAAALQAASIALLAAGDLPKSQLLRKWRILEGGVDGVKVQSKGNDLAYSWQEAPAELYLALAERAVDRLDTPQRGALGYALLSHVVGGSEALAGALALGYADESARPALDAFVAAQVRHEPMPEGGYVAVAGELLSRREYLRKQEEALIQRYQEQLTGALSAIRNDRILQRVQKLSEKKDKLDEARTFAFDLIFDEKRYFYPYRGVGRDAEYSKVQQEVDGRVAGVRELWEDKTVVSVPNAPELARSLKQFDEAARELEKRLVDVEEARDEVDFLRSYLGKKFDIRTLYRTPEERDLLRYTDEVMAFNPTVKGDITEVEREQVRVTNDYRVMFGRWPLRIVAALVLSSRGHCEEMARLNYFGHFSTTPGRRTPYDRMKLAGYEYGASENCILGQTSPQGAHAGWCHSSGHHRNILMQPWTEMGTGHYGRLMTQNYGIASRWFGSPDPITPGEDEGCGDEACEDGCGGASNAEDGDDPGFDYEDDEK